jgi:hypothetical protein
LDAALSHWGVAPSTSHHETTDQSVNSWNSRRNNLEFSAAKDKKKLEFGLKEVDRTLKALCAKQGGLGPFTPTPTFAPNSQYSFEQSDIKPQPSGCDMNIGPIRSLMWNLETLDGMDSNISRSDPNRSLNISKPHQAPKSYGRNIGHVQGSVHGGHINGL